MTNKKILKLSTITIPLTVLMLVLFTGVIPASATDLTCGTTLMVDTTLTHNLTACPASGLIIGADDIELDLNGFTLSGTGAAGSLGVDNTAGKKGVKIMDGTIADFCQGVRAAGVDDFSIERVVFRGDTCPGDLHMVEVLDGTNFVIRDSKITMGPGSPTFGEAMRLQSVDEVVVSNVLVHGGFVGVNFACFPCPDPLGPTNGVVEDSTFLHNFNGILIAHSTDATVKNNLVLDGDFSIGGFFTTPKGINVDFSSNSGVKIENNEVFNFAQGLRTQIGAHTGLEITKNFIHDNTADGMLLEGLSGSEITDNNVVNNGGRGMALELTSIGNEIKDNTSLGNTVFDMEHDVSSSPNLWEDNNCLTRSSPTGDIPAAPLC